MYLGDDSAERRERAASGFQSCHIGELLWNIRLGSLSTSDFVIAAATHSLFCIAARRRMLVRSDLARQADGGANVPYSYSYSYSYSYWYSTRTQWQQQQQVQVQEWQQQVVLRSDLAILLGFLAEVVSATASLGVRGTPEGPSPLQAASEKDEYKPRTGTSPCTWYQERPLSGPLVSDEALLKAHRHSRQPRRRTTRMDTSLCR